MKSLTDRVLVPAIEAVGGGAEPPSRLATVVMSLTGVAATVVGLPTRAYAAAAAGGGMPYSGFLGAFKTSITGEIAAIICVVAIVAGVATYIFASAFDGILLTIVRVAIGCAIIGSAVTMLTTMGVSGAIV